MTAPLDRTTLRQARALSPGRPRIDHATEGPEQSCRGSGAGPRAGVRISEASARAAGGGDLAPADAQRAWFADMLWRAFPAETMTGVSKIAAEELTAMGFPASERQVRTWLRCEESARFELAMAVLSRVGPEQVFTIVRGRS